MSRKRKSRNDDSYNMDMDLADKILEYYTQKETWFGICTRLLFDRGLKGGISITWGGMFHSSTEEEWVEDLFNLAKEAFSYRKMFGMCAVKISKKKEILTISIRPIGTGTFRRIVNASKKTSEFVWVNDDSANDSPSKNTFVYVWEGSTPAWGSKAFCSEIPKLYEKYLDLKEKELFNMDAVYAITHPYIFVNKPPQKASETDITEEDVYPTFEDDDPSQDEGNALDRKRLKRSVQDAKLLESRLKEFRRKSMGQSLTKHFNTDTNKEEFITRTNSVVVPIEDYQIARQTLPETVKDLKEWKLLYEEEVCSSMGVPRNYASKVKGTFRGDAQNEENLVKSSINSMRQDMINFMLFVYDKAYRELDSLIISDKVVAAEEAQQQDVVLALNKFGSKRNRISIEFNEDPFKDKLKLPDVNTAHDRMYISDIEAINLGRESLGIAPLMETDPLAIELIKKIEQRRKEEKERMKAGQEQKKKEKPVKPVEKDKEINA
jgi:hypothetical protein